MAASQFEALSPLQQFNQQQQQQQQQQQHQEQQHQQQQQIQQQQQQQQQQQLNTTSVQLESGTSHTPNGQEHPQSQPQPDLTSLDGNATTNSSRSQPPQAMMPVAAPGPGLIPNPGTHATDTPTNAIPGAGVTATATASSTDASTPVAPQRRRRPTTRPAKRPRSDDDAEALGSPIYPRPHVPHPLSKGPYETIDDAIFSLQLHVFTSGYGVSQKRTVKEKLPSGKYDPDGEIIRKDFACDKGGNDFVSQSRGERRRESKKCGCPWKAAIRRLRREGDRWFIEILETQHNHPVTLPDDMHTLPSYRRWQRENNGGIRTAISRLTHAASLPSRNIAAYLKGEFRDPALDRIDRQILRALSMNDRDMRSNERDESSVVFEMLARRPVIILQDGGRTAPSSTAPYGFAGVHPAGYLGAPAARPFNEPTIPFENHFASSFANPPNPPNPPNPSTPSNPVNPSNPHAHARPPPTTTTGTPNMHPEFPVAS